MFNYPLDVVMVFCGMWRPAEKKVTTPQKKFAVIVAAHNESAVIAPLIKNLLSLKYPRELYDVYVIADNCHDNTAEIAEKAGAIVCVRVDKEKKSKGFALEWMFEKIFDMEKDGKIYDAVAILAIKLFRDSLTLKILMIRGYRGLLR